MQIQSKYFNLAFIYRHGAIRNDFILQNKMKLLLRNQALKVYKKAFSLLSLSDLQHYFAFSQHKIANYRHRFINRNKIINKSSIIVKTRRSSNFEEVPFFR